MINFKTFQSEDNNKLKTKDQYSRNSCLFASRTNADETTCFVLCYDVLYVSDKSEPVRKLSISSNERSQPLENAQGERREWQSGARGPNESSD